MFHVPRTVGRRLFCTKKSPSHGHGKVEEQHHDLVEWMRTIEQRMMYRGHSILKWTLGSSIGAATMAFLFREQIQNHIFDSTANVAQKSLQNHQVVNQSEILARQVVENLLNDPQHMDFLTRKIRDGIADAVNDIFQDEQFQKRSADYVAHVLHSEKIKHDSAEMVIDTLKRDDVQMECKNLVKTVLRDPEVIMEASNTSWSILKKLINM